LNAGSQLAQVLGRNSLYLAPDCFLLRRLSLAVGQKRLLVLNFRPPQLAVIGVPALGLDPNAPVSKYCVIRLVHHLHHYPKVTKFDIHS